MPELDRIRGLCPTATTRSHPNKSLSYAPHLFAIAVATEPSATNRDRENHEPLAIPFVHKAGALGRITSSHAGEVHQIHTV